MSLPARELAQTTWLFVRDNPRTVLLLYAAGVGAATLAAASTALGSLAYFASGVVVYVAVLPWTVKHRAKPATAGGRFRTFLLATVALEATVAVVFELSYWISQSERASALSAEAPWSVFLGLWAASIVLTAAVVSTFGNAVVAAYVGERVSREAVLTRAKRQNPQLFAGILVLWFMYVVAYVLIYTMCHQLGIVGGFDWLIEIVGVPINIAFVALVVRSTLDDILGPEPDDLSAFD